MVFKRLAIWRHSFGAGGLGLLGCKPSSLEKERGKDAVLGRETKKEQTNHNSFKWGNIKGIWIQPTVTQMQQLRKISPGKIVFHHQKLYVPNESGPYLRSFVKQFIESISSESLLDSWSSVMRGNGFLDCVMDHVGPVKPNMLCMTQGEGEEWILTYAYKTSKYSSRIDFLTFI